MVVQSCCGRFTRVCGNLGTPPFAILLGILLSQSTMFDFGQSQNLMKPVFDHHTITNKPHNIQIFPKNWTKPVGHYKAPSVRPKKFQFLEKWQNRNFYYKIVISVKNPEFILYILDEETDFTVGIVSRNLASTSNFIEFRDSRSWHVFQDITVRVL